MSNLVLNRINKQINNVTPVVTVVEPAPVLHEETKSIPLSSEEIKNLFIEEKPVETSLNEITFDGIESFVAWYQGKEKDFTPEQNVPLSTLVEMRNYINSGCGCKRDYRLNQANEYYKEFWRQNSQTDLPQKVKDVGKFNSVLFCVKQLELIKI